MLQVNQWRNIIEVIKWFKDIKEKRPYKFPMFDINDFYPSIKEGLLNKALNSAGRYVNISKENLDITSHKKVITVKQ